MRTKKIIIGIVSVFITVSLSAQDETEALRYSQFNWGATARNSSVGGSFGAVGADFSSLSINPAGMALYKKSEISITPTLYYSRNINTFRTMESEDFKYSFNFGNFGLVVAAPLTTVASDKPKWKSIQFGFGVNRLANFNNNISIQGNNNTSSIIDQYIAKADGVRPENLDPFDTQLAYDAYVINDNRSVLDTGYFYYTSALQNGDILQSKTLNTKGSMNEWVFSMSGNYNDQLYLGGTIGLVGMSYTEDSQYEEEDRLGTMANFRNFTITDNLTTNGNGINFKFGFLYQPIKFFRVGGAIHTPTFFYSIEDKYERTFKSDMESIGVYNLDPVENTFKYQLNTPLRLMANAAFLIQKIGFVSFDYEFADYSTSRMRSADYNFRIENSTVKSIYKGTHNFRTGAELKLSPVFLRAGYAFYSSPFKSATLNDYARNVFSGGFGFRNQDYFIDFTYAYSTSKGKYYLYSGNPSDQTINSSSFILSMGLKF